jgi:putative intracellular protease/amidase
MGVQPAETRAVPDGDERAIDAEAGLGDAPGGGAPGARRERTRRSRRGPAQPAKGPVLIAGLIRSYSPRKGVLTIVAGAAGAIKGRVAKGAKVTLYTADYRIARPGDEITQLRGTTTQPGVVTANKVVIQVTIPPAAEPGQSPRRPGRRSRRSEGDQTPLNDGQPDTADGQQP